MKNDSWLFPFSMLGDGFFDSNHDGKLTGFETLMRDTFWLDQQRRWNENYDKSNDSYISSGSSFDDDFSSYDETDHSWREYCEDGSDYGIFPEDYETEEEYEETLEEAIEEAEENVEDVVIPVRLSISVAEPESAKLNPEVFPNKRRYEAAKAVADGFFAFESFEIASKFICQNADNILAANYLAYDSGFLYAQAIKDNFELPCSLPNEDEKQEMEFYEILVKLAKRDIPLTLKVWEWCIDQFGPYTRYDEYSANNLAKDVFDRLYSFSNRDDFISAVIRCFEEKPEFGRTVMSLSKEYYYNVPEFISAALIEKRFDVAEMLFKSELYKVTEDWRNILSLTSDIISFCSDGEQLEAMEYFRDNFFPVIKAIPDGMVQDEIPDFEKAIAKYISDVEDSSEQYAYTRKNAWRTTVPDGKEYGLDPICYDSEQEYLDDLNEAKYGWRQWYHNAENEYGLDVNDYETLDEFQKAMNTKRQEKYELERRAAVQKQREQQEEAAKDTNIYTYCGVIVPISARPYSFRTDDDSICIGDTVIVPIGPDNEEMEGTVVSIGQYKRLGVPYPVEKTKKVIRRKNNN